jgi:hypothetical protein
MRTQKFCCNDHKLRYFGRPEYARGRSRKSYWKDPERARANGRAWRVKHRDRLNFKARQKRRANPGYEQSRASRKKLKQRATIRAQWRLTTIFENTMLTKETKQEWQKLPDKERNKLRRALLAKAREIGILSTVEMETLA